MSTPTTVHLWFMYALIPLYLISPILKTLVDTMSSKLFKYCLVLWFVFSSVFPTLAALVPGTVRPLFVLSKEFSLNFINGYIGYFLLGYYLLNYNKKISIKLLSLIIVLDTAGISICPCVICSNFLIGKRDCLIVMHVKYGKTPGVDVQGFCNKMFYIQISII